MDLTEIKPLFETKWLNKREIFLGILLSSFCINTLALALPIVILQIYDRIIPNKAIDTLSILTIGAILAITLEAILKYNRNKIATFGEKRLLDHINKKSFVKIISNNTESSTSAKFDKIVNLEKFKTLTDVNTISLIADIPFVLIFLGLILYINTTLFMILAMLPAIFYVVYNIKTYSYIKSQKQSDFYSKIKNNTIFDTIKNLTTIKYLGIEEYINHKNESIQNKISLNNLKYNKLFLNTDKLANAISQIALIFIVGLSAYFVIKQQMSFGWLSACTILSSRSIFTIAKFVGNTKKIATIKILKNEIHEALTPNNKTSYINVGSTPNISISNLSLKSCLTNITLIDNQSLNINFKDTLLIVGANNSGKTLLLKTIAGYSKPAIGDVKINNQALYNNTTTPNPNEVSYIDLQDDIFDGTILENIKLFDNNIDDNIARGTAAKVGLEVLVNKLSRGYYTRIGQTASDSIATKIKQLIIIARAIIKHPKILLIDLHHSAISDREINQIISILKKQCTIIIATTHFEFKKNTFDNIIKIENRNLSPLNLDKHHQAQSINTQRRQ